MKWNFTDVKDPGGMFSHELCLQPAYATNEGRPLKDHTDDALRREDGLTEGTIWK